MSRVLVTGFYGRGNAGDEAVLQCLYEALAPHHEVVIATHPADTHPDHRNWYPYNLCALVDETGIGRMLECDPDALVIGGGGLSPAFGAHLALTMRLLGRPTVLAGTDNLDLTLPNPEPAALRDYMAGFRYLGLRYGIGVQATRALGVAADLGADWAFALPVTPEAPPVGGAACAVTVRAWDAHRHDRAFRYEVHALFHGLRAAGYEPFLLPFSPEDEALARDLAPVVDAAVATMWWNPRALKGVMAGCALVVSVGRLHPLILAAPTGVPVCHVAPPLADPTLRDPIKITETCRELGIARHEGVAPFLAALRESAVRPADPELVRDAVARCGRMAGRVLDALGTPPTNLPDEVSADCAAPA